MQELGKYRTLKKLSMSTYKEKGSRFIAHAFPCKTEIDAKDYIRKLRKENPQAVHVCFAWRFGSTKFQDRFSDDGEPNNSAGKPIFGQIVAYDITNILIAVVRFYGGTNLGVGGLIQAYKTAAEEALKTGEIVNRFISNYYRISFEIKNTGMVMQLLNQLEVTILEQGFADNLSTIKFKIPIWKEEQTAVEMKRHPKLNLIFLRTEE